MTEKLFTGTLNKNQNKTKKNIPNPIMEISGAIDVHGWMTDSDVRRQILFNVGKYQYYNISYV